MRIALFIILSLFPLCTQAQGELPLLTDAIKSRNLDNVKEYVNSSTEKKDCIKGTGRYTKLNREILPHYFESLFEIFACEQTNTGKELMVLYHLKILSKDATIIYHSFSNYDTHTLLWSDSDKNAMDSFHNAYKEFYKQPVYTRDLFIDNILFGKQCSEPLPYFVKMNKLVQGKNIKVLESWLRSPNLELQMYAILGFNEMHKSGYKADKNTQDLIDYIFKKQGKVHVCLGGFVYDLEINDLKEQLGLQ